MLVQYRLDLVGVLWAKKSPIGFIIIAAINDPKVIIDPFGPSGSLRASQILSPTMKILL